MIMFTIYLLQSKFWVNGFSVMGNLSRFIKNILICISKIDQSLMCLDFHQVNLVISKPVWLSFYYET